MNGAIITARKGRGKHLWQVNGDPLTLYPIRAAKAAGSIDVVWVCTDCPSIAMIAREAGCRIINRPWSMSQDESPHRDVIRYAVWTAEAEEPTLELVALLLGNTVRIDGPTIDQAVKLLDSQPEWSGVLTAWQAADDHPYRALDIDEATDCLRAFTADQPGLSDRQNYPPVYYYDQGLWLFRKEWAAKEEGPPPWLWMGPKCGLLERPWIAGGDVHTEFDLTVAEWWAARQSFH